MSLACEMAGVLEGGATASLNPPSVTPSPEQELIRQLQAGNGGAYSGFVERYAAAIFRVAHGILGNRGEAEEITQQVFVKDIPFDCGFRGTEFAVFLGLSNYGQRVLFGRFGKDDSRFHWTPRMTMAPHRLKCGWRRTPARAGTPFWRKETT